MASAEHAETEKKALNPEFWENFARKHVGKGGHVEMEVAETEETTDAQCPVTKNLKRTQSLKWNQWLSNVKVSEVMIKPEEMITITSDESVQKALDLLLRYKISSMPVQDKETHEWIGNLSLLDLMVYYIGTGNFSLDLPVKDMINLSFRNPLRTLDFQASVLVAMDLLSLRNIHRILITGIPETLKDPVPLVGFITQTSLAQWLQSVLKDHVSSASLNEKVRYFKGWVCKEVNSISVNSPLKLALETIWHERISAVAVVDSHGALVGTISSSDFKYVDLSNVNTFKESLNRPISEVLASQKADHKVDHPFFWTPILQATCYIDDSISQVLAKLCVHRVHRVWVVDPLSFKPIGVISLGDIIHELEYL